MNKKPVAVVVSVGVIAGQLGSHDFQELGLLIDLPLASVTVTTSVDAYHHHPITDEVVRLLARLPSDPSAKSS
jgi:hypothetical protein